MKHVHFIGIGGTGLSAIARVLLEKGYAVSGSDSTASPLFKAITTAGARTFLGHAAEQIAGADVVIRSSAIPNDNLEVIAAQAKGIPVLKRAEFLEEITKGKETLAVAGSHGKTTTTAMLIWILEQMGTDPSFIAGSVVNGLDCNARAGSGLYFAIEADEYDYMFLGLSPSVAIITNIEYDHPDCFPTEEIYRAAFEDFLKRVRPDGIALLCLDDPETHSLMNKMKSSEMHILGYGTSPDANYQATEIKLMDGFPQYNLVYHEDEINLQVLGTVTLTIPGLHNILNSTAALGTIHQIGLPLEKAIEALSNFTGTERRFEIIGSVNGITIIDDYGHHPTEIAATLKAARSRFPDRRIWAAWQPHTYSRTQTLEKAFIRALDLADRVVVLKIFAAREQNPGYSAEKIADALPEGKAEYIKDFSTANDFLLENLKPGDVLIVFSAGDATTISKSVLQDLQYSSNEKTRKINS